MNISSLYYKHILNISIILLISILTPTFSFSQGATSNVHFYSNALKMERNVQIYLPEGYNEQDSIRYPVITYLHGAGQNSTSESGLISILNDLIGSSAICPVIVVKPDGRGGPWDRSYFTNSELYGNFEDFIVYDLVEFIDSAFNTIASRDKRAIMGWSMGGYGAMKCALKHPDIYCGVVSQSGMLDMIMCSQYVPFILTENGGAPVSAYDPNAGPWSYGAFAVAGAFSPNLDNSPYFVDFPLDSMGNWIDSVWNRWSVQNCPSLVRSVSEEDDLAIYFDCGKQDETLAYAFNTSYADSLDKLGLTYEFQSYTGGHYDRNTRYPIGLRFLNSAMNTTVGILDKETTVPATFLLSQNYPNPFSRDTHISYQLSRTSFVEIAVYDLTGQKVRTLVNETKPAGVYSVDWDGRDNSNMLASSGLYIYRLNTGSYTQIRKMIILR
jgi:S-formylglutathione hydrolase FrmB